jgi:putative ABC transport system substrate-binding protein
MVGAATLLGIPRATTAQSPRIWRIGWLGDGSRAAREAHTLAQMREGLRELGYVEGKNIFIDARWSDGSNERLAQDAAEFVRLNVDLIVTHGSVGARAAMRATTTIPIVVATSSDFLGAGLVTNLARPGGNVTGTSDQAGEVSVKQLELLAEVIPGLQRISVLLYGANSMSTKLAESLRAVGRLRSLVVTPLALTRPDEIEKSLDRALRQRVQAVVVAQDAWTLSHRRRIVQAALAKRVPVIGTSRLYAEEGALGSYGPDIAAVYKRAAVFVDRILKGTKPGDIPVEQPTKFELVINLRTAKALGLTIPPSLLLRADHVIERS